MSNDVDTSGAPSTRRQPAGAELTARELEVLELVGKGSSNGEVGEALSVSLNTVKFHLKNAYRKLGVSSRSEVVLWTWRRRSEVDAGH